MRDIASRRNQVITWKTGSLNLISCIQWINPRNFSGRRHNSAAVVLQAIHRAQTKAYWIIQTNTSQSQVTTEPQNLIKLITFLNLRWTSAQTNKLPKWSQHLELLPRRRSSSLAFYFYLLGPTRVAKQIKCIGLTSSSSSNLSTSC